MFTMGVPVYVRFKGIKSFKLMGLILYFFVRLSNGAVKINTIYLIHDAIYSGMTAKLCRSVYILSFDITVE